jgi:type I restriction enzyme, S subunit
MTAQTDSNVPQIRFKGFDGQWEEQTLGEIGNTQSGVGFPDAEQGGKTGAPFFKVSDMSRVGNEQEMLTSNNYVSDAQLRRRRWTPISVVPAMIFAKVGAAIMLNRKRIVRSPFLIDNNVMAYIFDPSWDTDFGRTLFDTINLPLYAQVGALPSYNGADIESIVVNRPAKQEEQTKIGGYFRELDRLIGLHQRKHDKLVTLKKAMLQKMFPQAGGTTPEIRFKGFSGEWVEENLGKLGTFSKGQGYSKSDLTASGTPIVLYGRLYVNYQTTISGVDTFVIEKKGSVKSIGKEVIVPASGETAEDIARASAIVTEGIILGGDLNVIYPFNELDSCFLALTLSNGKPQTDLAKRAQGKTVVHVRKADLESIIIPFPKLAEQQKIGLYFRTLDELISKHAIQLQKLQQIKSACLEKMFV